MFFVTSVHIVVDCHIIHPVTNLLVVLKNNFAFNDICLGSDCHRNFVGALTNVVLFQLSVFIFVIDCTVDLPSSSQISKVLMLVGQ